jgi:DNA-binding beta-propeller fold protein YncE
MPTLRCGRRIGTALGRFLFAALFPASSVWLSACSDMGTGAPSNDPYDFDFDTANPIIYSQHVQRIFTTSCNTAACHNEADNASGLRLTSYTAMSQGSTFGAQVIPYRPDRSHLYLHLTGDLQPLMPLALSPLRDDVIRAIKRWIEIGAPNDAGVPMYSNVTRKAFVACQNEDAVAAIDLDSGLLIRLLEVEQPRAVHVDEAGDRLYVSRFETAGDNIHLYDANTHQLIRTGRGGSFPAELGIAPGTSQLWVTNVDAGAAPDHSVRVLDATTLAELHSFSSPAVLQPAGLAFSTDGTRIYVTNAGSSDVSIFGTDPPRLIAPSIPLPAVAGQPEQDPRFCALSADGTRLYVAALKTNRVHVLKLDTQTWGTSALVGEGPCQLAVAPMTNELWVTNWIGESVSILSLANPDAPVEMVQFSPLHPLDFTRSAFQRPIGASLQPGTNFMYVANANEDAAGEQGHHPPPGGQMNPGSVAIVNVLSRTVTRVVEVPNFARSVDFLP